jgi:hypothetical protein
VVLVDWVIDADLPLLLFFSVRVTSEASPPCFSCKPDDRVPADVTLPGQRRVS